MQLSISQIALLIEMTEVELNQMKIIIDNSDSTEQEGDDAGEHSMQLLSLSSALQTIYKEISADADMNYEELITDVHSRRL